MTFSDWSWLGPVLAEDFTLFQLLKIANSDFRPAIFASVEDGSTDHLLKSVFLIFWGKFIIIIHPEPSLLFALLYRLCELQILPFIFIV